MTWIRVDDRFFRCPEALEVGHRAALLYLEFNAYALQFNLNGTVPIDVAKWLSRKCPSHLRRLVDVGLLLETDHSFVIVEKWVEDDVYIDTEVIPRWLRDRIFEVDGYKCRQCGTGDDLSIDHIISRFRGGENKPNNLQTLCRRCNSQKGAW